ncbi:MAG: F0F1 ATP synthase subunit C, partial [Rhodospirillaceae bacterium]|nr:F0F1 ATP synthase subunit C [Rhodospirillaceae bacterium]
FASLISAISRNPASRPDVFPMSMLGFALVEAVALYALLISFLILFL